MIDENLSPMMRACQTAASQPVQWFDLSRAARTLGMPRPAVILLIKTRRLSARLCGGCRWFVRADDVRRYRQQQRARERGVL